MKKWMGLGVLLLCLLCAFGGGKAYAASKKKAAWDAKKTSYLVKGKKVKGLWKIGKNFYYFNSKGKLLKKSGWKKLKGTYSYVKSTKKGTVKKVKDSTKYKFYFKKGKALRASGSGVQAVKLYTIKGKKYGFDEKGHLTVSGIWATDSGKVYSFDAKGLVEKEKSDALTAVVKTDRRALDLIDQEKKEFGEPIKMKEVDTCNFFDLAEDADMEGDLPYTGWLLTYDHIEISISQNTQTGEYCMEGAFPVES